MAGKRVSKIAPVFTTTCSVCRASKSASPPKRNQQTERKEDERCGLGGDLRLERNRRRVREELQAASTSKNGIVRRIPQQHRSGARQRTHGTAQIPDVQFRMRPGP